MTVGINNDPKLDGMNPTAGGTWSKLQKEEKSCNYMATTAKALWQSGMTVGPSNNDPTFEGINPSARGTSCKFQK